MDATRDAGEPTKGRYAAPVASPPGKPGTPAEPDAGIAAGASAHGKPGTPAEPDAGIAELGDEFERSRSSYGDDALIACDRLVRIYAADGIEVQALQGLDLLIGEGELTAVVGASGSGKSTLMNILAGLDAPTAGSVRVAGHDLAAMTASDRVAYRRSTVGFVWQQTARNLLPYLTAQQNVIMPMRFSGIARRRRVARARELLEVLGVGHCANRRPAQLSGGEQQRTAIATALANEPRVLLADEPTGELDSATARDVFAALQSANANLGVTVLVVTHDPAVSGEVRRTIAIRDGRTASETLRRAGADEAGNATQHAVEYAVLDRAGRLQLPREMVEPLGMRDRVRLEAEPDHIGVWPDEPQPPGTGQPGTGQPAPRPGRHAAGGEA
jgi:ABC-type lipoprotein export system ATPase subunit